jgi:hypothetical protein
VSLLHVAGSLRRSYTLEGKVSYTLKLFANASRLGVVAERWGSVGCEESTVLNTGALEFRFGWLKSVLSDEGRLPSSSSNDSAGRNTAGPDEAAGWRRPSIWSGFGDGMRARGPSS